jgi:hypothetical protein
VDPRWQGEQALLPEKDGEVVFAGLVDALFASTAFPGAFPPQAVRHCVVRGGKEARCPDDQARPDLFVAGGVFDNTPVRLASRLAAAGLRVDDAGAARWLDAPDLSIRELPPSLVVAYVSTDAQTFPESTQQTKPAKLETLLAVTAQVGGSFLTTARAKNLLYVHDDAPEVFEQLLIPERHLPAAREAAAAWKRYRCLQAVMDGAPGAEQTCAGEDLRDFRIVFQTSIERLWDACARLDFGADAYDDDPRCRGARLGEPVMPVPLVGALGGDAWRRKQDENDAAYSMRLLAAHGFQFKDLGLARDEAEKAPALLRARFLEIGEDVARAQPTGQGLLVKTLVKMGADQVAYVPPRFTLWATYGRDPEVGISKGFQVGGVFVSPVRLHAAFQFVVSDQIFSSEGGDFVGTVLVGAEYLPSWWANTRLQPSILLRGGWMFSSGDDGGFSDCPTPGSDTIGACSRPAVQAGVSATVLERVRLQVTGNWYPPARSGEKSQWAIGPGIGVQWVF